MTATMHKLLDLLGDCRYHSGEDLASQLGISRNAVWKQCQKLRLSGLAIESSRGKGYRLKQPFEALDESLIRQAIPDGSSAHDCVICLLDETDSTNRVLRDWLPNDPRPVFCLAEMQTNGQGRRGHPWQSPFGSNLYASLRLPVSCGPEKVAGLSLAAGIAVLESLHALGAHDARLKWPNDILCNGKKIAGLLSEISGQYNGDSTVIIGIGINVSMPADAGGAIGQPWCDLSQILPGSPSRNQLAGDLLHRLLIHCRTFLQRGLTPFLATWHQYDCLLGQAVIVEYTDRKIAATAAGIDDHGALIIETDEGRQAVFAADVHLKRK